MSYLSLTSTLLGGIGLFLLGMALMTDGLKALAGARLRDLLTNLGRRPQNAFLAGATITALVQSSSATTLATIGFVSAGLMPFQTSIGVIVGANIGTTSTGWLVALLGLKFSITKLAMPIVGIGALLRIIGRDKLAHGGSTIAGFGMIFIGIDFLQLGMEGLAAQTNPADFAAEGFLGRITLVGFGLIMTIVMQSSSAAVATTLAALSSGALNLDQAAALVIGQNVGTTVTAVIGSIGAGVSAKRTTAIHVLFNILTGGVAILILPLFTGLIATAMAGVAPNDPALTIAAFHTAFNVLGALLFLPLARPMAHFVQRLLPERETGLTRHLHHSLGRVPEVASPAARNALIECMNRLMWQMSGRLGGKPAAPPDNLGEVQIALPQINRFMAKISPLAGSSLVRQQQIDLMRSIDHLGEAAALLDSDTEVLSIRHQGFQKLREHTLKILDSVRKDLHDSGHAKPSRLKHLKRSIAQSRYDNVVADASMEPAPDAQTLLQLMQMQHWIELVVYHFWRALKHLEAVDTQADEVTDSESAATETEVKAA